MELQDYLHVLRKRWLSIIALTALALAGAGAATLLTTPEYQAMTTLIVYTTPTGSASDLNQGSTFTQQQVQTYAKIANQDGVLRPAVKALEGKGVATTVAGLATEVTAEAPLDNSLIDVTVTDTSARRAALIADAVGDSLVTYVSDLTKPTDATTTSPVRVRFSQHATIPSEPSSPNVPLNLALGLLVGLAVGVGLAVLRETLDTTVRGEHDVARLDVPLLAGMPFDDDAAAHPLVVVHEPNSVRAETFRQLRTNLQFVSAAGDAKSIVVTSSLEGEGKTTTATNLAITLANAGTRVLLVDADLRRPMVANYLQLEGGVGLTTVLVGRATLEQVVQPWGDSGRLFVLPCGEVPPNPSELLASDAMGKLLREMEGAYDVVLLDGAPLVPVTDSAVLAQVAGGALLVIGSGRTKRPLLERSIAALQTVDARVLGAVLTMLPTKGADAYQTYSYAYRQYSAHHGTVRPQPAKP